MQNEVATVDLEAQTIQPWSPEDELQSLTLDEVRFSRGFLRADCRALFSSLADAWEPLFRRLGVAVTVQSTECSLDFPEEFDRLTPIEILGEGGVIGLDGRSATRLADCIVAGAGEQTQEILLEYLERRLIASIQNTWTRAGRLSCFYCGTNPPEHIEVAGAVTVTLDIAGEIVKVTFGLGMAAIEFIDMHWRELLIEMSPTDEPLDTVHEFSIELTQLTVPHELLVDFLRAGNVIPLQKRVSTDVIVMKNGEPWAMGRLMQFNGRFAAEIQENVPLESESPLEDGARILATFAVTELDTAGQIELAQTGALLLTREEIAPFVSLFISGEEVAVAEVGEVDGEFVLTIVQR